MKLDMEKVINSTTSLPSLPAVATQIVELAKNPKTNVSAVAEMLSKDPAITSKILRMVNSAVFLTQRKVENLHQAIVIMGLEQAMSMALSFSLISTMKKQQGGGLDYGLYWRRVLLAASAAKVIGEFVGEDALEELYLASLLQDIGMLALAKAEPDFYNELGDAQSNQKALLAYEQARMDGDHALLGSELLNRWNLAERTCVAVKFSHNPLEYTESAVNRNFVRSVALAGHVADLFVNEEKKDAVLGIGHLAYSYLDFDHKKLQVIIEKLGILIPEIESVFETEFLANTELDEILEQAREILLNQNIGAFREVDRLKQEAKKTDAQNRMIKESSFRDAVTGAYNRDYLESYIHKIFQTAKKTGKPVSIAFVSVQGLQDANHKHGHKAGDKLLCMAAKLISAKLQPSNILARYGGGEFVVVMPGANADQAAESNRQIEHAFECATNTLLDGTEVTLEVKTGAASQAVETEYQSVQALFSAAEVALFGTESKVEESGGALHH